MSNFVIYFNPKCSKCRIALGTLNEKGANPEVVEYLNDPPSREALSEIVDMLSDPVADLVRKDQNFAALNLDSAAYIEKESVIELLVEHPELMQRPVVVRNGRAVIARSPEAIEEVLES